MNLATEKKVISVIMPCYNSETFLEAAVESVLGQSYPYVELIIVDDGSTDGSNEILSRYSDRAIITRQDNRGPYPARNAGIKKSSGDFITFLDADDYWDKDYLKKSYDRLIETDADLVYCGWKNVGDIDVKGLGGKPYIPPDYNKIDMVRCFLKSCPWPIHAALVNKKLMDAVGGFSERSKTAMDYDLWLKICSLQPRIVLLPEVLAFYRWHGQGQISSISWQQTFDAWETRRCFVKRNPTLIAHISQREINHLVNGFLLEAAYKAFWQRDIVSSQKLFRKVMITGYWKSKDLKYIAASLLPEKLYRFVMNNYKYID